MNPLRRLLWGISALAVIVVSGVPGYMTIESWPSLESICEGVKSDE